MGTTRKMYNLQFFLPDYLSTLLDSMNAPWQRIKGQMEY